MIEHSPGITRLLDRLEARSLVCRERCPDDHRQVLCRATEKAQRLLVALDGPMAEAGRRCVAALDAARTAELIRLLDEVRAAAASSPAPASIPERDQKRTQKETRE
jgi:DNA-binding MarR family transcriptional regulator